NLGTQQLTGAGDPLNVVGVGMGGDDHLAGGQVEVHAPDQLDDLLHRIEIADVDQDELAAAVDQVDVHPEAPAGLKVHLDDTGEEVLPLEHDRGPASGRARSS